HHNYTHPTAGIKSEDYCTTTILGRSVPLRNRTYVNFVTRKVFKSQRTGKTIGNCSPTNCAPLSAWRETVRLFFRVFLKWLWNCPPSTDATADNLRNPGYSKPIAIGSRTMCYAPLRFDVSRNTFNRRTCSVSRVAARSIRLAPSPAEWAQRYGR